jgi:aconitate hydratase
VEIDLDTLEPLIAQPHSPDAVVRVRELKGTPVQQVCIGSCTNSSYHDLAVAAEMLHGRTVNPNVSFTLTPGSKQVFEMIASDGHTLADLIAAGARVLESACGPCIGMGQAPSSGAVSIRSFNRNFEGRSGTVDAKVYLASPETCTACGLTGEITDPRDLGLKFESVGEAEKFIINDNMLVAPPEDGETIDVVRGPNIKPLPMAHGLPEALGGELLLKVADNITTDHIMPAGAKVLPLRSNIPAISEFVFERVDASFPKRSKEAGGGFILGGVNYGQGSSREHAALAPMYLGVKAVLAKSFARIHWANLVNFGILPLTFENEADYDRFTQGDKLELPLVRAEVKSGKPIIVRNVTKNFEVKMLNPFTERQVELLLSGGLLNYIKHQASKN